MRIAHLSREYRGLGEAGGVKDVVRDLARMLASLGHDVTVFHPHYGILKQNSFKGEKLWSAEMPGGWLAQVSQLRLDGVLIYLVGTPWFDDAEGIYTFTSAEAAAGKGTAGAGYPTERERTLSFQAAIAAFTSANNLDFDAVHAHDAHTAMALGEMDVPVRVLSIHNAGTAYQQNIDSRESLNRFFSVSEEEWTANLLGGSFSPILFASRFAQLFTVSRFYAAEILAEDGLGETGALGPELKRRRVELRGVYNGLDFYQRNAQDIGPGFGWASDWPSLPQGRKELKGAAKAFFLKNLSEEPRVGQLPDAGRPWFFFQGRLTRQKGIDELVQLVQAPPEGAWFVIMGLGEASYQTALTQMAEVSPCFTYFPYYDEAFLKILFAASDFFLAPSVYEPCALTDLMAMRMGTIPLVRATGGLQKVREGVEGFLFREAGGLRALVEKSIALWRENGAELEQLARRAWKRTSDFEWKPLAEKFWLPVYQGLEPAIEKE